MALSEPSTSTGLEREAAWGKVWMISAAVLLLMVAFISNDYLWHASKGAGREVSLRVAYEDYLSTCGQHCILISGYVPLNLKKVSDGTPASPADYARAQSQARNMIDRFAFSDPGHNSELSVGNVTIGDPLEGQPEDWSHIGG